VAGKYRRGRIWWLTWQTPTGQQRESTGTESEREAELYRKAKELELELGRPVIIDEGQSPTLEELAVLFLRHQERAVDSAARNKQSLQNILPYIGSERIDSLSRTQVKGWILDRLEVASPGTVKRDLATLRRMLNLAIEWGYVATNPAARVRVPSDTDAESDIRWYDAEQLKLLYDDPERGNVWKFYANTGLRRCEGLNIMLEHIQADRMFVVSREGARTKSRKTRVVPLTKSANDAITALRGKGPYLLPRLHPHTLTHYFTDYARSVGLPGSLHWLRHSFGHHWVRSGRNLRQLQLIMGHSSYAVTERYARLDTGEIDLTGFGV
jgi:integrase